ncbi:MAG: hypothetical protein OXC06_15540 [Acidimicrobiaceae bacterium]|nr:hypothetical protein [Acidimicrobiaceae bacterium]
MITNLYVDGFNLYYRALKDTPFRWLGFGIDAITGVLNVAAQYDATRDTPATVTRLRAAVTS